MAGLRAIRISLNNNTPWCALSLTTRAIALAKAAASIVLASLPPMLPGTPINLWRLVPFRPCILERRFND